MPGSWSCEHPSRHEQFKAAQRKLAAKRRAKWEAMRAAMIAKRTPTREGSV